MIRRRDMILIGAASRNAGKTAFACRIIKLQSRLRDVTGLKITPFHEDDRPGSGRNQGGPGFRIREERIPVDSTDTGRMLAAGAGRAYWLEARADRLEDGLRTTLEKISAPACLVAEGNSARRAVEPGLFILLKNVGGEEKDTFRELLPLADRAAAGDGREWDTKPEECLFLEGEWMLKPRASAIVLAGGDSRRMGRDKALLPIAGKPMIAHIVGRLKSLFDEIVIGAGRAADYEFLGLPVVPDRIPGQGPLMGIASALDRTKNDLNFVIACDIPDFELGLISRLAAQAEGFDAAIPLNHRGEREPLFAFYRKSVLGAAQAVLIAGGRSMLDLLALVRTRTTPLPEGVEIRNINTAEEYKFLRR
jgi:molybdopterin-guanine dinucleotide biosynthesis protein A